jgi:hypothetical protein
MVLVSLVFLAFGCTQKTPSIFGSGTVEIGNQKLNVEVAQTDLTRQQGLSGRESLAQNDGMLFVFPSVGRYAFWMKGMRFPLDFIWIKDNQVVEITANAPTEPNVPDAGLFRYLPKEEVDSMIEVNAGWAKTNKIKVGDEIFISQPTNK